LSRTVTKRLLSRGTLKGIPEEHRPSEANPAIKDLPLWIDGELDFLPEDQRPKPQPPTEFCKLRYQLKGVKDPGSKEVHAITAIGIGSGVLSRYSRTTQGVDIVYEHTAVVEPNDRLFIAVGDRGKGCLVFPVSLPKSSSSEWGEWHRPSFVEPDGRSVFGLMDGEKSPQASTNVPADACRLRFRLEGSM